MKELMVGTGNQSKVKFFQQLLKEYDVKVYGCGSEIPTGPDETGRDPAENALEKARFYGQYAENVLCADSGLYFVELAVDDPRQPGLHVRSPYGVRLNDEEMIAYYAGLVKDLGGRVNAYYQDGTAVKVRNDFYTYLPPREDFMETAFTLTDTPVALRKPGCPLDSLSIDCDGHPFLESGRKREAQQNWGYLRKLTDFISSKMVLVKQSC